ncbi:hypothetical protein Turpa_2191 [Turneriella parva DSM 21527]|uniref:Uncharacterized protein n=1 Tax=Turneriella parva (strain ATCC BAA-1111 / DSM 21527 / NCTC 11395 / H) TaxID=869212 RepID=I4B6C9_TURPD|nr:hypothetical protein Turpa_2191 [Turneriella parva DSM 21527]
MFLTFLLHNSINGALVLKPTKRHSTIDDVFT